MKLNKFLLLFQDDIHYFVTAEGGYIYGGDTVALEIFIVALGHQLAHPRTGINNQDQGKGNMAKTV